jgi:hypothetical protein
LAALRRSCDAAIIEIQTIAEVGVPYTIAQRAIAQAKLMGISKGRRKPIDSYEENDQVWAVFDRDAHPRFTEAVMLCEEHSVGVAQSNPCFEIWLILHEVDYDKPDDRHAVQAFLKSIRKEYDPRSGKCVDCAEIIGRVDRAEARAERQLRNRSAEGMAFGPPSTTVGRLTRAIRTAAQKSK